MSRTSTIILTTGTSWTVPSDWTDAGSTIACIGGGGGARRPAANLQAAGGGGGGAYASVTAIGLVANQTVFINIGSGGPGATTANANGTAGGDTWLNKAANSAPALATNGALAKGGSPSTGTAGGAGGVGTGSSVGSTLRSGGTSCAA